MKRLLLILLAAGVASGCFQTQAENLFLWQAKDVFKDANQLALLAALAKNNFQQADRILTTMPVDAVATNGGTALWWQVNVGNFEAFSYLIKKGANPNRYVSNANDTMELCAQREDARFLKLAIEHKGIVNLIGAYSYQTPIYAAISSRKTTNVQTLIEQGASLTISDPVGMTPLLWAATCKNFESVIFLLKAGADPETNNNGGLSAIDIVRSIKIGPDSPLYDSYTEAMKLLESKKSSLVR